MALVDEFLSKCTSILEIADWIMDMPEDWFSVSDEYMDEVDILKSKLEEFRLEYFRNQCNFDYSLPVDRSMVMNLDKAEMRLRRTQLRLETLQRNVGINPCWASCGFFLYAKLSMILFPVKLEKIVKSVTHEIEKISSILKIEADIADHFEKWKERKAISAIFHDDDGFYVPIKDPQSQVFTAIEDYLGPPFVLLHGGVGKGKSTLARFVCGRYGRHGNKRNIFEHVILVECGNDSTLDPSKKQLEILQTLSPSSLGFSGLVEYSDSKARIAYALRDFLSGKKVLIILDDLSDESFLNEMCNVTEGGTGVRYLVTSRLAHLCGSFRKHYLSVWMGDPNLDEARQILASHVGLKDKVIPLHLQGIADKMIEVTNGNPLALACLASGIHYGGRYDLEDWDIAYEGLPYLLDEHPPKLVLGRPSSIGTFMAAINVCVNSLKNADAKVILFLIYACKGESVPEEVLRILYSATKCSSPFLESIEELSTKELLQPRPGTLALGEDQTDEYLQKSRAWSLRSLMKLYMDQRMAGREEMRSVFGALLGGVEIEAEDSENRSLAIAVCALYFDRAHTDQVVADKATRASNAANVGACEDGINELRRKATEPIIWLLDQLEQYEDGAESNVRCARKVFLKYICEGHLDYDNISVLLKSAGHPSAPLARLATLTSITDIFIIEEVPLLNENSLGFLKALVQVVDSKDVSRRQMRKLTSRSMKDAGGWFESTSLVERRIQEAASKALLSISLKAVKEKTTSVVANTPRVFAVLVRWIQESLASPTTRQSEGSDVLAENAAGTLWNLVSGGEESSKSQILGEAGALTGLVKSLSKRENPILQENAAGTLALLNDEVAGGEAIKSEILKQDGALAVLVELADCGGDEMARTSEAEAVDTDKRKVDNALLAVAALFSYQTNAHGIVAGGTTWASSKSSKLLDSNYYERRKAIEPIGLSLLDEPNKDLRQVYLKYVSEGQLDYDIISTLLDVAGHPVTLKILTAIENIFRMESERPLLRESSPERFLEALVNLMGSNNRVDRSIQEAASKALLHISKKAVQEKSTSLITDTKDIFAVLVTTIQDLFATRTSDKLVGHAAGTLRELGYRLTHRQKETSHQSKVCGPGEVLGQA